MTPTRILCEVVQTAALVGSKESPEAFHIEIRRYEGDHEPPEILTLSRREAGELMPLLGRAIELWESLPTLQESMTFTTDIDPEVEP